MRLKTFYFFWFLLWISKRSFTVICAMFDLCDTRNTSTLQYMKLLFHLRNIAGLELLLFFFSSVCLKMLLTRLTVGWAAFQLAVYCGVSLNNQTTQVKCLQSFKHFILRASLGNRQAKKIRENKTREKNANERYDTSTYNWQPQQKGRVH